MSGVEIRTAYGPKLVVSLDCGKEGGAKQSFKAECDVNNIVKQFSQTGEFSHLNLKVPFYGDVTGLEFRQMLDFVAAAQASFMELPALTRKFFDNDPQNFVAFCTDPGNMEEMVRMGLATVEESGDGNGKRVEAVERGGSSAGAQGVGGGDEVDRSSDSEGGERRGGGSSKGRAAGGAGPVDQARVKPASRRRG